MQLVRGRNVCLHGNNTCNNNNRTNKYINQNEIRHVVRKGRTIEDGSSQYHIVSKCVYRIYKSNTRGCEPGDHTICSMTRKGHSKRRGVVCQTMKQKMAIKITREKPNNRIQSTHEYLRNILVMPNKSVEKSR